MTITVDEPRPPTELMVFGHWRQAAASGFQNGRHRQFPWIQCWCVGQDPEAIRGMVLSRVTIAESARLAVYERPGDARSLIRAKEIARRMLREMPQVWIEL